MRVAVNGAGIAGGCLAYWLERSGHDVVLIEKAPQFRTGGYGVDFWGVGYTVAERMGILPEVRSHGYTFREGARSRSEPFVQQVRSIVV